MSPAEAKYPESWRSLSLDEQRAAAFLDQPTTVARILDPHSPLPEALALLSARTGYKDLVDHSFELGRPGERPVELSFY